MGGLRCSSHRALLARRAVNIEHVLDAGRYRAKSPLLSRRVNVSALLPIGPAIGTLRLLIVTPQLFVEGFSRVASQVDQTCAPFFADKKSRLSPLVSSPFWW